MTQKNDSVPIRIDAQLYAEAGDSAKLHSRSKAQQLAHWARIGRELESSPSVSVRDVEAVLAKERSYDDLGLKEQAIVRAAWSQRLENRREQLNLEQEFASEGRAWVELDEDGRVVRREPEPA